MILEVRRRYRSRFLRLTAVLAAATLALAACGGDSPEPSAETGEPPETEVQQLTETFVDTSRGTDDPGDTLDAPDRTLVTEIYVPPGEGPFPLVVFAHGVNGHPRKLTELLTSWAEAGYFVAAPAFPLTNDELPIEADFIDYTNQPADVSFVIDELLRLSAADNGDLAGLVDLERIGVAGHSLGGGTVYGVAFHPCCRDDRISAAILMAPFRFVFDGEFELEGIPILLMHGTDDDSLPYDDTAAAYAEAGPPKYFVTLVDGLHSEPFEDTPSPHDEVVTAVTLDFWDLTLGDDPEALDRLVEDAVVEDLTTFDHEAG